MLFTLLEAYRGDGQHGAERARKEALLLRVETCMFWYIYIGCWHMVRGIMKSISVQVSGWVGAAKLHADQLVDEGKLNPKDVPKAVGKVGPPLRWGTQARCCSIVQPMHALQYKTGTAHRHQSRLPRMVILVFLTMSAHRLV